MEKNTLNEKNKMLLKRIQMVVFMFIATTVPVFADISNVGENLGGWGLEQIWWFALAVVGYVLLKFIIKKAWGPAVIFALVGGAVLYLIKYPDKLTTIGEVIYRIATR